MNYSEEHLRDVLEVREWISEEIEKREREIEKLKQNLHILDSLVKQSSFSKASNLLSTPKISNQESSSVIPIKTPDNKVIANAHVTADELVIIPDKEIMLDVETQPFKSFFLGRIVGGMQNQDNTEVQSGKIAPESVIQCMVNKDGTRIREILIKNYRQKDRVNEIINTVTWSFSRMIENSQK